MTITALVDGITVCQRSRGGLPKGAVPGFQNTLSVWNGKQNYGVAVLSYLVGSGMAYQGKTKYDDKKHTFW